MTFKESVLKGESSSKDVAEWVMGWYNTSKANGTFLWDHLGMNNVEYNMFMTADNVQIVMDVIISGWKARG